MSNNKMKGLLKGLRYISQIFDNEKEPEMKIGHPTDVKHVAHIGWDGPSVNSPSWINEYKSPPGFSPAPISLPEDIGENNVRRDTRATNSPAKDLPELPRSSRRHSSAIGVVTDQSPTKEKSEKSKQTRRSSKSSINKDSLDGTKPTRSATRQPLDPNNLGSVSPAHSLPDIPKKARRKKVKEYSHGSTMLARSSRLKPQAASPGTGYQSPFSVETYQSPFSDPGPGSGSSLSTSKNNELYPQSFEEGQQKGFPGIY